MSVWVIFLSNRPNKIAVFKIIRVLSNLSHRAETNRFAIYNIPVALSDCPKKTTPRFRNIPKNTKHKSWLI